MIKKKNCIKPNFYFLLHSPLFCLTFSSLWKFTKWHPHRRRWSIKSYFMIYQNLVQRGKNNEILFLSSHHKEAQTLWWRLALGLKMVLAHDSLCRCLVARVASLVARGGWALQIWKANGDWWYAFEEEIKMRKEREHKLEENRSIKRGQHKEVGLIYCW